MEQANYDYFLCCLCCLPVRSHEALYYTIQFLRRVWHENSSEIPLPLHLVQSSYRTNLSVQRAITYVIEEYCTCRFCRRVFLIPQRARRERCSST